MKRKTITIQAKTFKMDGSDFHIPNFSLSGIGDDNLELNSFQHKLFFDDKMVWCRSGHRSNAVNVKKDNGRICNFRFLMC